MSFSAYSLTPSSNTSINSISIGENCPAANVNNALRQLAADGRELYNTVSGISVSGYLPLTGGTLSGQITRSGSGGYLYNAGSSQPGGAVYVLPTGSSLPSSPQEGTFVYFY